MEEIRDLYKNVKIAFYERIKSPLTGTFIIAFIGWNWKAFYLTLFISENKITGTKIDYIVNNYYNLWTWISPLLISFFFIVILPYISRLVLWINTYHKIKLKKMIFRLEEQTPISFEEAEKLREDISNVKEKIEEVREEYTITLKENEEELEIKNSEIRKLNSNFNELLNEKHSFEDVKRKLLHQIDVLLSDDDENVLSKRVRFVRLEKENDELEYSIKSHKKNDDDLKDYLYEDVIKRGLNSNWLEKNSSKLEPDLLHFFNKLKDINAKRR